MPLTDRPERIDALAHRGSLVGSEHLGRYLWAAQLVEGKVVLDAGCGTGYGLPMLLDQGAERVLGIDISDEAVAQAASVSRDKRLEVRQGDLASLAVRDDELDLIVCFEVIEHVEQPELVLDEFSRVLKPDGILCISTPNRGVYPEGNPYHVHEFTAEEFLSVLKARFSSVTLYKQSDWLASTIGTDHPPDAWDVPLQTRTYALAAAEANDTSRSPFVLAMASNVAQRQLTTQVVLGEPFEVGWWQTQLQAAERTAAMAQRDTDEAQRRSVASASQLLKVEAAAATLNARAFTLQEELEARQELIEELREEVRERTAEAVKNESEWLRTKQVMTEMKSSLSWRLTSPLRTVKRLLTFD